MRSLGGSSRGNAGKPSGKKPSGNASDAGRLFFPQSQALGIGPEDTVSPAVLQKMVYAGTNASSFKQASEDLLHEAELTISAQRIMRATKRIGGERTAQRDAEIQAWEQLPLPEQQRSPRTQVPAVAVAEMDGGRMQIRERKVAEEEAAPKEDRSGYWRETKVGCLLTVASEISSEDPCPTIPQVFVDPRRMRKMVREIKGFCAEEDKESSREEAAAEPRKGQPVVLVRSVVATRQDVHALGRQLAAAAWQRGFAAAPRKAFVGDGQEANWTVHRTQFSQYVPILDFIHGLCYVYAGALAGRRLREGWPVYLQWAQWVWSGEVEKVIEALKIRLQEFGPAQDNESEESPRQKVADALRYLQNQKPRMRYDEYRRQGLPLTSSHIESTIKQINHRVKGSEKFWSNLGAEALLQLAADHISETKPLTTFWRERPARATGQRSYQTTS
jgi:hypothetical protein